MHQSRSRCRPAAPCPSHPAVPPRARGEPGCVVTPPPSGTFLSRPHCRAGLSSNRCSCKAHQDHPAQRQPTPTTLTNRATSTRFCNASRDGDPTTSWGSTWGIQLRCMVSEWSSGKCYCSCCAHALLMQAFSLLLFFQQPPGIAVPILVITFFFCTLAVCPLESPAQTSSPSIKGQQWAGLKLRLDRCALPQQKVPWSGDQAKEAAGMSICKVDLTFQSCCFGGKSSCTSGSPERHLIGRTTFSPCQQHQQHPASQNVPAHKLTC